MATNTSSKYDDIISRSLLNQSGYPARYQLTPKKTNVGTLRRKTFGDKSPNKMNKTILLVGETGAGKSTLINALVNYTMGVQWEDDVWFEMVEDEDRRQSGSQTSDVIVYQIFGFEDETLPYSLTIIDTPGFRDIRGIERDVFISQRLFDLFRSDDGVHQIDAVGLVLKASENRLSDRLRSIFDSVASLFGKNMKNIVALITHSDGLTPENALQALKDGKIKCARDEEDQPLHFIFNNLQSEQKTGKTERALKYAWETTTEGMKQFTDFLKETEPQTLKTTVEVLNSRIRLTACIHNLQDQTESTELRQKEIQQTREELKKHEEEMKNNKEFTVEVDEVYKDKEPIDGGRKWLGCGLFYEEAVCCKVCEENCHYPGSILVQSPESCEVMKDGRCTSCTRKCPVSDHVKDEWIYVSKTRRVKKTLQDVREKYEKSKTNWETTTSLLEKLEQKIKELEREKEQRLEESFQHVVKLEQIALNVNSRSTYVHLDFLIEKMKEKGDTEKVQKLEEMKRRVDEGVLAGVRYKPTAAAKAALKNAKISSKYDDIISKSLLIQSGSPARYQLTPKKEKGGTLRRKTFGDKSPNKMNKTILLVGETGAGKSALINALVNYTMGVQWEDDIWFEMVEDEDRRQSESQTSDVIVYQIFGFEGETLPYSLTIIDTPGFRDISGIEHDVFISQRLLDLFRSDDGVHQIDAVGLVLKASANRLSDRLRYVFDSVASLFGKNMKKNIVALITHSDGRRPKNALKALEAANIQCARDEENQLVHFSFDSCQHEDRTEDSEGLGHADKITMKGMKQFTDFLKETEPQTLKMIFQNEQIRLTACIHELQGRIVRIELKQRDIQQSQAISGGLVFTEVTYCSACEESCHCPCKASSGPDGCEVMKDGRCTVCSRKCLVSHHVKGNWRFVNEARKGQQSQQDGGQEKNEIGSESKSSRLETLNKEMNELQREKEQMLEESFQHVVRLEQIALSLNSLSTYVHLDFLIEKMKEKGDTEKVQKLEEMKRRVDERTRRGLQLVFRKLSEAVKEATK